MKRTKIKDNLKLTCPFCNRKVSKNNIENLKISNILKVVASILEELSKKK